MLKPPKNTATQTRMVFIHAELCDNGSSIKASLSVSRHFFTRKAFIVWTDVCIKLKAVSFQTIVRKSQETEDTLPYRSHSLCGYSAGGWASFSAPRWEVLELREQIIENLFFSVVFLEHFVVRDWLPLIWQQTGVRLRVKIHRIQFKPNKSQIFAH